MIYNYSETLCGNLRKKKRQKLKRIATLLLVIIIILVAYSCAHEKPVELKPVRSHGAGMSIETMKYQVYFQNAGAGIHALEVANAVQQSKRKRLTAAICRVESEGVKTAKNKQSGAKGLFQVKEEHWGKVNTKSALAMTAQHDAIMDELLKETDGNLKKALNLYGGDTKNRYSKIILAEMKKVP